VIGTLLALLVFFALFGIFLTQYVPLWMTENEAQFSAQASTSFAQFKAYVDSQYLIGGPSVFGTPFQLSSYGVPLIAQPTQGSLIFVPISCPNGFYVRGETGANSSNWGQPVNSAYCVFENITLSYGPAGSPLFSQHVATGLLEMQLPNRYYSGQMYYYEDDGVVQSQGGPAEIMAVPPPLNITNVDGNTSVTSSYLQMFGNATTIVGQGSQQVFSHLRYSQTITSGGKYVNGVSQPNTLNVTFEIGTPNPCAWQRTLWSVVNSTGLSNVAHPSLGQTSYNWSIPGTAGHPSIPVANPVCASPTGQTTIIAINLHYVDWTTIFYAGVQVTLGVGGT